jgi:hypothetical protein
MDFISYKKVTQSQKRNKVVGLQSVGYLWHRNVSAYISYGLLRLFPGITPNFVSLIMIMVGVAGSVLTSLFGWWGILGVLLVYISFLLDKVDGEIARWRRMSSVRGMYLDEIYHTWVFFILLTSVFFTTAYDAGPVALLILIFLIFCTIYRRYDRKIFLMVRAKNEALKDKDSILPSLDKKNIQIFLDKNIFKLLSIVERFDIFLLCVLFVKVFGLYNNINLNLYLFYGYSFFSALYTARWFLKNYFGVLDAQCET